MVDEIITKQELINAKADAKTLEDTVNGPPDIKVTSRLGRQYWTLATIDSKVASVVSQADYALVLIQNAQDQIVEIADTAQAQFDVKMADLEGQANSTINEWQAAINTIVINDGVPALSVSTATGQDQQEINDFGGAKWRDKAGGYKLGATVKLANGDTVKSTVANNNINPNIDMVGWVKANDASQIFSSRWRNQKQKNSETVTPFDFGALGKNTHAPVSDWYTVGSAVYGGYANLAAVQVDYPHVTSSSDSVDWAALQAFFNFISLNTVNSANWGGDFSTNKELNYVATNHKTRTIEGRLALTASQDMPFMLRLAGAYNKYGDMYFDCALKASYGLYIGDNLNSTSSLSNSYGNIVIVYGKSGGVFQGNFAYFNTFKSLKVNHCGSTSTGLSATYSNIVHNTGDQAVNQYSTINCTALPPAPRQAVISGGVLSGAVLAEIEGQLYQVNSVDAVNGTVDVRPQIRQKAATGNIKFYYGAGYHVSGGSSSCSVIDSISCNNNGIGMSICSLYAMLISSGNVEGNGVGLVLGSLKGDPAGSFVMTRGYFEVNKWDYAEIASPNAFRGVSLPANILTTASKIVALHVSSYVSATNVVNNPALQLAEVNIGNEVYNSGNYDNSTTVNLTSSRDTHKKYVGAAVTTFTLTINEDIKRLFNRLVSTLTIIGGGRWGSPQPQITFNAPSGYTINGAPSLVIPAQNMGAITIEFRIFGTNIIASVLNNVDKIATVAYDPPSLAAAGTAGDSVTTTVTLTGAVLGDNVSVSFSQYNAAIEISCQVSAANTVTVKFKNTSASAVDIPSGTIKAKIV